VKKSNLLIASAVAAALTLPFISTGQGGPAPKPKFEPRSANGVSKPEERLQTANSSCAGPRSATARGRMDLHAAARARKLVAHPPAQTGLIRFMADGVVP